MPIGRPIANTQLYVLDQYAQPVPVGVHGELYIGGAGVALGYHNRPEITDQRFVDLNSTGLAKFAENCGLENTKLYRTGDIVRYQADGNLVYLGRIDNQIKLRGYRVELGEVEGVLAHLDCINEAAVIAQRRSDYDVRLIAYVVMTPEVVFEEKKVRRLLAEILPAHMVPSSFIALKKMPLTKNGKVDRSALPLPQETRNKFSAQLVPLHNEVEKQIAQVWCELLEVDSVGGEDNFFEIGGHSLLVIPLRVRLQALFNCAIAPVDIFRLPTVAMQAKHIEANRAKITADTSAGLSSSPLPKTNSRRQRRSDIRKMNKKGQTCE